MNTTQAPRPKLWDILNPAEYQVDPVVQKLIDRLSPRASVFEYGTGRGRNLIPLLQAGFTVHAQDCWSEAIEDVRLNTRNHADRVLLYKSSAESHSIIQKYDAFVCIRLLHFLKVRDAWEVIVRMQENTHPGGYNALSYFTDKTAHRPEFFFPGVEELEASYLSLGWETVIQSEICPSKPGESTNGRVMYQKSILLRKPE